MTEFVYKSKFPAGTKTPQLDEWRTIPFTGVFSTIILRLRFQRLLLAGRKSAQAVKDYHSTHDGLTKENARLVTPQTASRWTLLVLWDGSSLIMRRGMGSSHHYHVEGARPST